MEMMYNNNVRHDEDEEKEGEEGASLIGGGGGHSTRAPSSSSEQQQQQQQQQLSLLWRQQQCRRCFTLGRCWRKSASDRHSNNNSNNNNGWLIFWLLMTIACGVSVTIFHLETRRGIQGERFGVDLEALSLGPPRVALCFFGPTRSLKWTLPSAQKRVLDVLKEGGMEVDVFAHAYDAIKEVNNERTQQLSKHHGNYSDVYEQALHTKKVLVTSQEELDASWPTPIALAHYRWKYPEAAAPGIVRSIFRGYWSMATVWSLMELYSLERGFQYDAVILARPDVWFHVDIDLPRHSRPLPAKSVFLPSFDAGGCDEGRINDRFAYGAPYAMKVLMNRISTFMGADAPEGQSSVDMDSERLLGRHMKANNISVSRVEFPLSRVRANGEVPDRDHACVEEACSSGEDPTSCELVRLGFKFSQ